MASLLKLSTEVLVQILSFLPAKTLLNATETCKWLKEFVLESDCLWKQLCFEDFVVFLKVKGSFPSFFAIYQALYKYDIVQRQIYEEKCQLTFFCDVFNLPDYLYHWCTLLNQYSTHWPLARTILKKEKFKKMWGLQDADLAELPPNGSGRHSIPCDYCGTSGFIWDDGFQASVLKYDRAHDFHEVALNRCKKSVKRIEKKFTTAARILRARKLLGFLQSKDYNKIMYSVIRKDRSLFYEINFDEKPEDDDDDEELGNYFSCCTPSTSEDPCRIGVDYVRGLLHKSGFQQIVNFSDFCNDLLAKSEALPQLTEEDVKQCTLFVYETLSHKTTEKLMSAKEFEKYAEIYQERIDRVWEWQCEKGEDHKKKYRGQIVKSHQHYKNYVQEGNASDLAALKTYFDGIEKLKKWVRKNKWIQEIVKPQIINIVRGSLSENLPSDVEEKAMHEVVSRYLTSGKTADFNQTLLKLSNMCKRYLEANMEKVRELEESISVPLRVKKASKTGDLNN